MLTITEELRSALDEGRAVVALESTIIAHGLPYPDNRELALALEGAVREQGAVPATIALIDGVPHIGLGEAELERVASPDAEVAKAAAADLSVAMARGVMAATTVSATSTLAHLAGIRFFATGGIGGVHRGEAWDVSADLLSLSTLPVAVISAGPKAILDLPKTREALESLAVLVAGFGTDELPCFYSRESGIRLDHRFDDESELARVLRLRWEALGQGGAFIANPVPPAHSVPRNRVESWVKEAMSRASDQGIGGKGLTPFLLATIADLSGGESVRANCELALNNARLAARLAVAYQDSTVD